MLFLFYGDIFAALDFKMLQFDDATVSFSYHVSENSKNLRNHGIKLEYHELALDQFCLQIKLFDMRATLLLANVEISTRKVGRTYPTS